LKPPWPSGIIFRKKIRKFGKKMKRLRQEKRAFPLLWTACLAALFFTAVSCTQDPIFSMISREVKPREPLVKGVPSKMAVFRDSVSGALGKALYVGSTSLHRYAAKTAGGTGAWDTKAIPQPPGGIIDLAATTNYLYALTNADSPALYRWNGNLGNEWEHVPFPDTGDSAAFPQLQAIYGETDGEGIPQSDYLFVGARAASVSSNDRKDYAVFYANDSSPSTLPSWPTVKTGTSLLTGAVMDGNKHYISTGGDGIYLWDGSTTRNITGEKTVKGMILIKDLSTVLAFTYNGDILQVSPSSTVKLNSNWTGQYLWGPSTVYKTDGDKSILLVTVITPDSTYGSTYGYREINLNSGPVVTSVPGEISLREPGNPTPDFPSTMDDLNRFRDTIATKPVNSILQVPYDIDREKPLFASIQGTGTMTNDTDGGLWSYRNRDGGWQWNAE
jgi:hypothetical protein